MLITIDEIIVKPPEQLTPGQQKLRETAGKVVGQAFYGTLLKTMRSSKLKGEIGHGGRGEDVFAAQLHGIYAERIGASDGQPLVEAIYRSYAKQAEAIDRRGAEGGIEA